MKPITTTEVEDIGEMLEIIIPTYNRPAMLAKTLLFLADSGADCPIHIADGSSSENVERNARAIARAGRHIRVLHHSYPPELPMYQRIALVVETLSAPYILLHADDDFLFLEAVKTCVAFLERNPTYACCQGPMISCFLDQPADKRLVPYVTNPYDALTAVGRAKTMLYHYTPTFYAVHRRIVLFEAFGGGSFYATDPRLDELMSALHTVTFGRSGLVDDLYGMRLVHSDQTSQDGGWLDLMTTADFSAQWTAKLETVVACASRMDSRPVEEVRSTLRRAFLYYLRRMTVGIVQPDRAIEASRERHLNLVSDFIAGRGQFNTALYLTKALAMV